MRRSLALLGLAAIGMIVSTGLARAHCQIPCGIYGDDTQFDLMAEHVATIEKSMKLVVQLQSAEKLDGNQLVRWVGNKDLHADKLSEIVTFYFMAQRLKPVPETDTKAHAEYLKKLELLHQILVETMKSKQTTDLAHVAKLRELIEQFRVLYLGPHDHAH